MSKQAARRPLKFESLGETVEEIRRLEASGYTMAGRWDLAKACQHLSKTMQMSIEGAPFNLPSLLKPFARWMLWDSVMNGKPTRLPLKTAPQFQPDPSADPSVEISQYESLVQRIQRDDAPLLPEHPVFGPISQDQWRTFHSWHAAHHLSFLIPKVTRSGSLDSTQSTSIPQHTLEA